MKALTLAGKAVRMSYMSMSSERMGKTSVFARLVMRPLAFLKHSRMEWIAVSSFLLGMADKSPTYL